MATKKGIQTQKWLLLKISKDDRIPPNKRLLATMLLGYIEGLYPWDLIEATYGLGQKVRWADKEEPENDEQEKASREANVALGDLYRDLLGGKDGGNTTSTQS